MNRIEQAWHSRNGLSCLLWPLSLFYGFLVYLRRIAYARGWFASAQISLPVVVVGNISIGGTGKSPLCSFLVEHFKAAGWRPAIVSRGYGGLRHETPYLVCPDDTAEKVGDEPLMLHQISGVPVCVCIKRALAVDYLAENTDADIVFADDGLQHLALPRVAAMIVIDAQRGFGNSWLLPAGPLRERTSRLSGAQIIAVQGEGKLHDSLEKLSAQYESLKDNRFSLLLSEAVSLVDGHKLPLSSFADTRVVAMAGIGYPQRFFDALRSKGLDVYGIVKSDHHSYRAEDLGEEIDEQLAKNADGEFTEDGVTSSMLPVLVTSKDAVKLRALGRVSRPVYEITTSVKVSDRLLSSIDTLERSLRDKFL